MYIWLPSLQGLAASGGMDSCCAPLRYASSSVHVYLAAKVINMIPHVDSSNSLLCHIGCISICMALYKYNIHNAQAAETYACNIMCECRYATIVGGRGGPACDRTHKHWRGWNCGKQCPFGDGQCWNDCQVPCVCSLLVLPTTCWVCHVNSIRRL